MNITWDKEEGYHRLETESFSVLVTELDKLEEKYTMLICHLLKIQFYNSKRIFPEIRERAMDIYISERINELNSQQVNRQQNTYYETLTTPPPLPERNIENQISKSSQEVNRQRNTYYEPLPTPPPLPERNIENQISKSSQEVNRQRNTYYETLPTPPPRDLIKPRIYKRNPMSPEDHTKPSKYTRGPIKRDMTPSRPLPLPKSKSCWDFGILKFQ